MEHLRKRFFVIFSTKRVTPGQDREGFVEFMPREAAVPAPIR
jgi:hypothetical protein